MADNSSGYLGQQSPYDGATEFGALSFLVNQILNGRNVATLVQIRAVTNTGGLSPVGFVDVLPLINQLDGYGNVMPHGVVHNLPYFRMQGGTDAIILDPKVGDIGMAVFADRDLSAVKVSKAAANPGSARRADYADGMYIGGFLNGVPAQYIQFTSSGINVVSPSKITCIAPNIELDGATSFVVNSGAITLNGPVSATSTINAATSVTAPLVVGATNVIFGGKSGTGHTHSGVTTGSGNTGAPV
jgi:hypothetical protein